MWSFLADYFLADYDRHFVYPINDNIIMRIITGLYYPAFYISNSK